MEEKGNDDKFNGGEDGVEVYVADEALDLGGLKQVRTYGVRVTLFAFMSLYDCPYLCILVCIIHMFVCA